MIGLITFQFSNFSFGIGNAAGLLLAGIMLGFYVPTTLLLAISRKAP